MWMHRYELIESIEYEFILLFSPIIVISFLKRPLETAH